MTESELDFIAIYDNLVNLRVKPQTGGKNANCEAQLVSNLRIDTASVTKEISRYRACDSGSCLYCREWASFIYKKNYTLTAKNQGQNINENNSSEAKIKKPKEAASEIRQHFCDLIVQKREKNKSSESSNEMIDLVDSIAQKVFTWIESPSSLYKQPDFFNPVEFNTPQQETVSKQENDQLILDVIEVEKSHLQIQKNSFPHLKHIGNVQQCNHTRPDWKNPNDLDVDRRVFNDQLSKEAHNNKAILDGSLGQVWSYVNEFLTSMLQLESKRDSIFEKGCVANLSRFLKEYQDECLPFNDYWAPIAEAYKKSGKSKKGNSSPTNSESVVKDIDTAFYTYINNAKTVISFWEEGFIENVINNAIQLGEEAQQLLINTLVKSEGRLINGCLEEFNKGIMEKCADALRTAKDIKLLISKRVSILREEITTKDGELVKELEALKEAYENESQKTLLGRLEKASNVQFRKRIKKFEAEVQATRQHAIISIGNLFPVVDFTDICMRCLEILMVEGEMWEAVQLGRHYKNYEANSRKLVLKRQKILKDYHEGIETGQKVLSGIIGRLFLKEAQRQHDEILALEKQESFLQSMGQDKKDSGKKKKGEKDQSTAELVESSISSEGSKKKKKKKKKSDGNSSTLLVGKEIGSESKSETPAETKSSPKPETTDQQEKQQSLTNTTENNPSGTSKSVNSETESIPTTPPLASPSTNERRLSIPPGLSPPGDVHPGPITNDQSLPPNGVYDDASKLNLDGLNKSDLISLIQNLFTEKTQLVDTLITMEQEVKAITARYTKLLEMARDHELQTIQVVEARKQKDMEEAMKYIQTLQLRITQLEKQNHNNNELTSPKSGSSPGSPIGGFSNSQSTQSSSGFSLFPPNRTGSGPLIGSKKYLNPWRTSNSGSRPLRCGNCGDQGHVSQECTIGCRYCGNLGHLSENCEKNSNFGIFGGASSGAESGIGISTDKSDNTIDQNGPKFFN